MSTEVIFFADLEEEISHNYKCEVTSTQLSV